MDIQKDYHNIIIALLGTLFGGAIVKLIDRIYSIKERKLSDSFDVRKELREEILQIKQELRQLQRELDKWKKIYYELLKNYNLLETHTILLTEDYNKLIKELKDDDSSRFGYLENARKIPIFKNLRTKTTTETEEETI